jgi:hypothetical protein
VGSLHLDKRATWLFFGLGLQVFAPPVWAEPPPKFVSVKPLARGSTGPTAKAPKALQIGQGRFFSYAKPPDWSVGEDGQFALSLVAPDKKALTVMVGNSGLPPGYPPGQFAWDKLMALGPQDLAFGEARPSAPITGFAQAIDFEVRYLMQGVPCRGLVKVSVAGAYDTATMAMTAALSVAEQWPGYAPWLPQVANQISAIDGAAFGMRGLMQQNLQNSTAYAEAAKAYRSWSQKNWQAVTDDRAASQDRRNTAVRENLGGVQTYTNPFGTSPPLELPTTYPRYWADAQGNVIGTHDPNANPNVGDTQEWRLLERVEGR